GSDLGGRGRPRESPFCSWENQSGCQRSEGVLEARRLTSLECPHDGALRFGERAYALGVGLLARRCELGQNTAAVLRIGTPAGHPAPTARYSCTAATSWSRSAWVSPSSAPKRPRCASSTSR